MSIIDTETGKYLVIANAELHRYRSSNKKSLPSLNSLTIEWINSHPENTYEEPTVKHALIYSTEGPWNIRIIEVGVASPPV